jgi:hypothetical protein
MKKVLLVILLGSALSSSTWTAVPASSGGDSGFQAFLPRWEEAQSEFLNGDATLWKQKALQTDDATIFGAFGGYEKGWKKVGPRYDWATSQYKPSGAKKRVQYLNTA